MISATPFSPAQTVHFGLLGLATGSLYALVALGIVLVYRSSRVLNFSAGGVGAVAAFTFYTLRDDYGVNWILALVLALCLGGGLGALTQVALMRVLHRSSQLTKLIATLALMVAVVGLVNLLWGDTRGLPNGFLPVHLVRFGSGVTITEDRLILIGIVVIAVVVLRAVYSHTLFGLATSAVAENRLAASTSGWSPSSVELVNFAVGGVLSALAAIFLAPIVGLDASVLSLTVVPALAAALVGRFAAFGLTVGAALVIGVVQSILQLYSPASVTNISQVAPLLVILAILVLSGRVRPSRGESMVKLPLPGSGALRPGQLAVWVATGLLLLYALPPAWSDALAITFGTAILLLSVVVVTGYGGQLSLCQLALGGFGCWVAARLATGGGLPFGLAMLAGVAATVVLGVVLAIPVMRTRGVNLGVATLAVAMVLSAVIFTNGALTGGFNGLVVRSPTVFGVDIDPVVHPERYGTVVLVVLSLLGLMVANIRRGRVGRRLLAARSNERAAASLGVSPYSARVYAFAVGAGIAAFAGVFLGFRNPNVSFDSFDVQGNVSAVLFAVIGGVGWPSGSVLGGSMADGALGSTLLQQLLHGISTVTYWLALFTGINVVIILRQAPDGLAALNADLAAKLRRRVRGRIGRARKLDTPAPRRRPPRRRRAGSRLEVESATVRFGGVVALQDVSIDVSPGEVVGLMGSNGAGKTTLIDVISGFTKPTAGTVRLGGARLDRSSPEQRARRGLARTWQAVELFEEMTVEENLLVAADGKKVSRYLTDMIRPGSPPRSETMQEIVRELDLAEHLGRRPSSLPQGSARLVGIARALVTEPSILLLDEPAAGLAQPETAEMQRVIRQVAHEQGLGVLLVEHDVELLMSCCDRIVVLDFGRVIAAGTPEEVARNEAVAQAYLGLEAVPEVSS